MSRFSQQSAMSMDDGVQVQASVKWFNLTKGFGFVAPGDGTPDAFLHISVLNRAGLQEVAEGTEMTCCITQGPKGPQVTRIVEITGGAPAKPREFADSRPPRFNRDGGSRFDRDSSAPRFDRNSGSRFDRDSSAPRFDRDSGDRRERRDFAPREERAFTPPTGPEVEMTGTVKWFKTEKGFGFVAAEDSSKDVFVHKSLLRHCGVNDLEPGQRVQMRVQEASKGREATWITLLQS